MMSRVSSPVGVAPIPDSVLQTGAAGDIIYYDGTEWKRLTKDAGKYLKSGAAAVSWDDPSGITAIYANPRISYAATRTVIAGTWAYTAAAAIGGFVYNSSNTNADEVNYSVPFNVGTYKAALCCEKAVDKGIVDVYVDGTKIATFDTYNNGDLHGQQMLSASFSIATAGVKTVRLVLNGKTGSGYVCAFQELVFELQ